ncbi:MAG: (Fe-S)-binding protein [Bacteriovoracaceae bacterium]|nr:(Fe-S)-binding protein [Bacteroidota bacterium]
MKSYFTGIDLPSNDILTNCMHCGLCLPVCPTFALTGKETSSPRGRIRLIKAVAEGTLDVTDGFINEMNFCLDCQACETACPAGVRYGSLVEAARNQIRMQGRESTAAITLKWIFLRNIVSKKYLLKLTARILGVYQSSGLEALLKRSVVIKKLAPKLAKLQELSPRIDGRFFDDIYPEIIHPSGQPKYRVGFLSGCIMNVAFASVHEDTVKVLLHHDCEVIIPKQQVCCGSLQAHNGDFEIARQLAKKNIDVFLSFELDAIVMNSAGCGALMKEYGQYLRDDPTYAEKAERLAAKVKDISEFLYDIGLKKPVKEFRHTVSYHDACHLVHSQKVSIQPRSLLQSIPGIDYVELNEASWCCGSAGIYNVIRHEDSMNILDRKMSHVKKTGAEYLVANNPGCLTQIEYGCAKENVSMNIVHLATLLRVVYEL